MRLIKLAAYLVLGYVIYELFQGMSAQGASEAGSGQSGAGRPTSARRGNARGGGPTRGQGGRFVPTNTGEGQSVEVTDASGASSNRVVGRGVVNRT